MALHARRANTTRSKLALLSALGVLGQSTALFGSSRRATSHDEWCLPARLSLDFEGNWKGLMLWGQLPIDGPVYGHMELIQGGDVSNVYFIYRASPNVIHEQWAVWKNGGRAITIGRNTTTSGSRMVSDCVVLHDRQAAAEDDPRFCSKSKKIDLRFHRDVNAGPVEYEEWIEPVVPRVNNSTLKLMVYRPPATVPQAFASAKGFDPVLPLWHWFGDGRQYFVNHLMHSLSPVVNETVFAMMPEPSTCHKSDVGPQHIEVDAALGIDTPGEARTAHPGQGATAGSSNGCPFAAMHSSKQEPEVHTAAGHASQYARFGSTCGEFSPNRDMTFCSPSVLGQFLP